MERGKRMIEPGQELCPREIDGCARDFSSVWTFGGRKSKRRKVCRHDRDVLRDER